MKQTADKDDKIWQEFEKRAKTPFPEKEKQILWNQIENSIKEQVKKHFSMPYYWAAAVACLVLISIGYLSKLHFSSDAPLSALHTSDTTTTLAKTNPNDAVKLITVGGDEILFDEEEPEIVANTYSGSHKEKKDKSPRFNQVIVPVGKKTSLIFEDGSKLWINSNSTVTYPEKFVSDKREIFVDGEVFADISPDKARPFTIQTKWMQVEVLGTKFNLNAYANQAKQSVVLVSGKVDININNKHTVLLPNSMLVSMDNTVDVTKNINVYDYTCWKDDVLILNAITFAELSQKLNHHYGCEIIADKRINNRILSGKLDLKNSKNDAAKILAKLLNCNYQLIDNKIILISEQ